MNITLASPPRIAASSRSAPAVMSPKALQPSRMLKTGAFRRTLEAKTIAAASKKTGHRMSAETPWPVSAA